MNENTARAWGNTRRTVGHWATSTRNTLRDASYDTWNAITGGGQQNSQKESPPLSPNASRVNEFLAQPRMKF
jgi:hypothetical protein